MTDSQYRLIVVQTMCMPHANDGVQKGTRTQNPRVSEEREFSPTGSSILPGHHRSIETLPQ
jgi:hypothetical protein